MNKKCTDLRRSLKSCQKMKYLDYITLMQESISTNPKSFWTFVNTTRNSSSIPRQMTDGVMTFNSYEGVADMFNSYFKSIYVTDDNREMPLHLIPNPSVDSLSSITINEYDVLATLKTIDITKACGADNIPGRILRECAEQIAFPITMLFNKSLKAGIFPSCLKRANVIPLFKSGKRDNLHNYRPISLLPLLEKIYEKLVYDNVHMFMSNQLGEEQHGFTQGRSVESNLSVLINSVACDNNAKAQTDVIYTDFIKAFGSVNHRFLLHKLKLFGFSGNLLQWF